MPFDGIGIAVAIDRKAWQKGKMDTSNMLAWNLFGPKALKLEDFRLAIADLKATRWQRFTDNFLPACICSSGRDFGFNWFDEVRWNSHRNGCSNDFPHLFFFGQHGDQAIGVSFFREFDGVGRHCHLRSHHLHLEVGNFHS